MGLLSLLRSSMGKSSQVTRISKVLSRPFSVKRIRNEILSGDTSDNDAIEQLLDLCMTNEILKPIVQKHQATREQLKKIHTWLAVCGAGQWVNGMFVEVAAMAFPDTLDYLLNNYQRMLEDPTQRHAMCYRMIKYYESGKRGPVPDIPVTDL